MLDEQGGLHLPPALRQSRSFLDGLDLWASLLHQPPDLPVSLPFHGGWFLFFGYEFVEQIEPTLKLPPYLYPFPKALAVRCPAALVLDHSTGTLYGVIERDHPAYEQAMDRLLKLVGSTTGQQSAVITPGVTVDEDDPNTYLNQVIRIKDYIRAGDVFQVNLSREWRMHFSAAISPGDLYYRLTQENPAPFSGLVYWGDSALISSSPERLVASRGGRVQTRPIAGTRPRALDPAHDDRLAQELMAHPKERAEHRMLIDLERNDLGRICVPGSIRVNELMALESYAHVHHIVSNIVGTLKPGVTPGALVRAVFPGGTITGCPKVRCMEIIAELEACSRGPYTGSMGYMNRDASLDLNILIRTLHCRQNELRLRAGAGIVADSEPQSELEETRAKAKGLLRALNLAPD